MKIPIGQVYTFTTKVVENDSIAPQDLEGLVSARFSVMPIAGGAPVFSVTARTTTGVIDTSLDTWATLKYQTVVNGVTTFTADAVDGTSLLLQNGLITFNVSAVSSALLAESRGPVEDGYYLKPGYRGVILLEITDVGTITVTIDKIYALGVG